MALLFSVPYLARILLSLLCILVVQKAAKSLAAALMCGTLILALWTGHSFVSMGPVLADRIFSLDTLFLSCVIAGVIWLSSLMSEAGMMRDLVASLKSRLSKRNILAVLPAVVGLLPMPAGAVFSAPLLDDADEGGTLSQIQKTRINYWFRHVWEFWWPLYPGILLAVDMSGLPIWKQSGLTMPLFFAAAGAGFLFLLRGIPAEKNAVPLSGGVRNGGEAFFPEKNAVPLSGGVRNEGEAFFPEKSAAPLSGGAREEGKAFFPLIIPTLTVIAVYGFLIAVFPAVGRVNRYFPMVIGIVCGLAVLQFQRPASAAVWKKVLLSKRTLSLVIIVILARVYGGFIEGRLPDGTLLMESLRGELNTFGIPALLLIIIIPFVSGLTTGITVGYIGASFPVVLSLAGPETGGLFTAIILGYACGFLGMMLSPIHVCLIVTNEYYKTSLYESLKGFILPALFLFACAAAYAFVWSFFP